MGLRAQDLICKGQSSFSHGKWIGVEKILSDRSQFARLFWDCWSDFPVVLGLISRCTRSVGAGGQLIFLAKQRIALILPRLLDMRNIAHVEHMGKYQSYTETSRAVSFTCWRGGCPAGKCVADFYY